MTWRPGRGVASGIGGRRLVGAFALEAVGLPVLTICLAAMRSHLAFADELLLYLAAVIGVTLVGGFLPAVVAAVGSSLLLNWYFTPPVHRWTIGSPQNLLALVLFVAVAVIVSSVVHLAARRAVLAAGLATEAARAQGLADANRIRTTLLAAVGHDLRTPLASVKASVSTLRQTDVTWSPQDQAELLATIEEGADRLNALIGNLLDMSRIQAGAVQLFVRPTSLEEVAPLVVQAVDDGALLKVEMSEDLPLFGADPGLLERALANLVVNALRYSPPGRPPTLAARAVRDGEAGGVVQIEVIDHGPGVPPDEWERIVAPFEQYGDQRGSNGVGLGLAVTKGFVEAMGGKLSADATAGGGLTMRIELPVSTTR
ncbi:MAG TPA: ATP-binding protein [Acidothermaceae bacterium]|jgi:two-component system sensor histidine kinase KdpD|nr:ATP-binding protein [Acidothermaceae bacterium]